MVENLAVTGDDIAVIRSVVAEGFDRIQMVKAPGRDAANQPKIPLCGNFPYLFVHGSDLR